MWGKMYEDVMVVDMNYWKVQEWVKVPMKVHNYVNQSFTSEGTHRTLRWRQWS